MTTRQANDQAVRTVTGRRRKTLRWIAISTVLAIVVLAIVGQIMIDHAGPILKGRVIETLSTRFNSEVDLDRLSVSLIKGLQVDGEGLKIFPPDDVRAAGATKPLIAIAHFQFHANLAGLFVKPMHIGTVYVAGLQVEIPPREVRQQGASHPRKKGKIKIVVDEIVCDDSNLVIQTLKPGKDPKDFVLKHIALQNVGGDAPWRYQAILINAVPKGEIHSEGVFGPWQTEDPGSSTVIGHYTFDHADLNPIKGIGGMLSSAGDFTGQLNRIAVVGTTETPNFSLDTAVHGMPLHTAFQAVVDGTTGDTYLNRVDAKLGETRFTTNGAVVNIKGRGHAIDLDIDVPDGRIQDFLELAIKTQPAIMDGRLTMKTKLHIEPGPQRVAEKISMRGEFTLRQIHFSNPEWEDKVDMLSLRAQGDPKAAKPGAPDVQSKMTGQFDMDKGALVFKDLDYALPGASVKLQGVYSLDGNKFDFNGKVRTEARISQMVASRWKSLLLKPVDPFFAKNGAGAEIPIKITGTKSAPKFGLDIHHKDQ